jgi:hypothetical protein
MYSGLVGYVERSVIWGLDDVFIVQYTMVKEIKTKLINDVDQINMACISIYARLETALHISSLHETFTELYIGNSNPLTD